MDQKVAALLAKQEINDALVRYCRGIDRLDAELIRSAYHADAFDDHGLFKGNAHEFASWVTSILTNLEVTQHRIGNVHIDLRGEAADVETYFLAVHVPKASSLEEYTYGRYVDRFECRNGDWKIADRKVVLDFTTVHPRGNPYPYEGKFLRGSRDRLDPSYAGR